MRKLKIDSSSRLKVTASLIVVAMITGCAADNAFRAKWTGPEHAQRKAPEESTPDSSPPAPDQPQPVQDQPDPAHTNQLAWWAAQLRRQGIPVESSGMSDAFDGAVAAPAPPPPAPPRPSCLNGFQPGAVKKVVGTHGDRYSIRDANNVAYDFRQAKFTRSTPIAIQRVNNICLSGGVYDDGSSDTASWETHFHQSSVMLVYNSSNLTIENATILQGGDAFTFKEGNRSVTVRDSYVRHAGDDSLENDRGSTVTVENVLFDWSYTGFSCRKEGRGHSAAGRIHLKNVLMAMRPQAWGFENARNSNGRFWKQTHTNSLHRDNVGCRLVIQDSTFLVPDTVSSVDPSKMNNLGFDPLDDAACDGHINTVVIAGASAEKIAKLNQENPRCFRVTNDLRVWENARNKWFQQNKQFERYRSQEPKGSRGF